MKQLEISGKIIKINQVETVGKANNMEKRTFILQTDEKYPQELEIELIKDAVTLLNPFSEGDRVIVGINLRGRSWTNPEGIVKHFNSIQSWRISQDGGAQPELPTTEIDEELGF